MIKSLKLYKKHLFVFKKVLEWKLSKISNQYSAYDSIYNTILDFTLLYASGVGSEIQYPLGSVQNSVSA